MEIVKKICKKNCYVGKNKPKFIVIHETDNTDRGADADRHAKALANGNLSTSVHYFVDDKKAVQTLAHTDGAWAVGKSYGTAIVSGVTNYNSINIEICVNKDGNYEKARLNCVELVKKLMKDTGIPASRVIRHYDAKRKTCPRHMVENPKLWDDFKKRLTSTGGSKMDKVIAYVGDVDKVAATVLNWKLKDYKLVEANSIKGKSITNLVVVGGGAEKVFPSAKIRFVGKDRFDTVKKVLDYVVESTH